MLGLVVIGIWTIYIVSVKDSYREAFAFIWAGIGVTIRTALFAYVIALILGLIAGLGRISTNVFIKNFFTLYVELIRGIPMLVVIFYIALVGVPSLIGLLNGFGMWLISIGAGGLGQIFTAIDIQAVPMDMRAVISLAVTYGAFQAEIFRAGIQSIGRGQMEAARSLGMSYGQAMRYIILPQAIRNVLPALGNDFIAMVKDSSLVSVLAVRDITQVARLYAGTTFRFAEAYTVLAVLYLTMTIILSLFVNLLEKRFFKNEQQQQSTN
ncbi:MAG: amino acid ABC transporter permease [Saprospiraceae bacterium]|nr:amino acid ABC transporter permease [Saprospiraceae bacterium]